MENRSLVVILLFIILTLTGFGFLFYQSLEFVTTSKDVGFSQKARKNRFLLAQVFLENDDRQVSSHSSIQDLPIAFDDDTQVVISTIANPVTARKDIHRLETWIKKGGTYVVSMNDNQLEAGSMNQDYFAKYFDVILSENKKPDNLRTSNRYFECEVGVQKEKSIFDSFDDIIQGEIDYNENDEDSSRYAEISNDYESFQTLFLTDNDLTTYDYVDLFHHNDFELYYLVKMELGKGVIWFNFSNEIFNNEYLGCADHAKLLDYLVEENEKIAFLSHVEYTDFKSILIDYAKPALVFSVILFILVCWYFIKHLFQHRRLILNSSPKFSDHILAISYLIKRENSTQGQIIELIDHINDHAKLIIPECDKAKLIELIQAKTKLNESEIEMALSIGHKNINDTTKQIKLLQTIRKAL